MRLRMIVLPVALLLCASALLVCPPSCRADIWTIDVQLKNSAQHPLGDKEVEVWVTGGASTYREKTGADGYAHIVINIPYSNVPLQVRLKPAQGNCAQYYFTYRVVGNSNEDYSLCVDNGLDKLFHDVDLCDGRPDTGHGPGMCGYQDDDGYRNLVWIETNNYDIPADPDCQVQ